jgi:glucose/mannose-6-phosphate isomerase
MNILDKTSVLEEYNDSQVIQSIEGMSEQISGSWQEALKMKLPIAYQKAKQIVFCGMGGSNLSSEMVRDIFGKEIKKPFVLVRGYGLPGFVTKDSLVVISSYSGNTEETVSCLKEAKAKKAKIICISSGGKIITFAKRNKIPYFKIDTATNPSSQPRYGVGLQLGAILAIFHKLKIIKIVKKDLKSYMEYLVMLNELFGYQIKSDKNIAKIIAEKFKGHLPILVASEFLSANAHIICNQINEGAKSLAVPYKIPELNHHLMEGLSFPTTVKSKIKFLFLNSGQYSPDIRKRFEITKKVLKKQDIKFVEYNIDGDSKLLNSLEMLLFGGWFSFYLSVLNKQNPANIPWVNYFKQELAK